MKLFLTQMPFNKRRWLNFPTVTVFILPILTIWTVSLIGELMLSDITVLILAPLILLNKTFNLRQPYLRPVMFFLTLWLLGVIFSDFANENSMINFLRGALNVIFFALHIFVIFVLINGKKDRGTAAIMGVATSFLLRWMTGNSAFSDLPITSIPWKMGCGLGITLLVVKLLTQKLGKRQHVGRIMLLISPIHLLLNARSLFLTTVVAAFLSSISLKGHITRQGKVIISLIFGATLFVALPLGSSIYSQIVSSGFFGEEAQLKHAMQTANGTVNIILAGRSEMLISLKAIEDAPILGHGSWPENENYYYEYLYASEALGRDVNWARASQRHDFLIPSHSILFGTWVSHGVFGAIFWLYILILTLKSIGVGIIAKKSVNMIELQVLIVLLWDLFFSPFGQMRRCTEAVFIVIACCVLSNNMTKNS
jgi:hypothetical protein